MITAVTLALGPAFEPAAKGIMDHHPRDSKGAIASGRKQFSILAVLALLGGAILAVIYTLLNTGVKHADAQATALTVLALEQQLAYTFVPLIGGLADAPSLTLQICLATSGAAVPSLVAVKGLETPATTSNSDKS